MSDGSSFLAKLQVRASFCALVIFMYSCHKKSHTCTTKHSLQWRQNEQDGVSNDQPHDCLFNCLLRQRSKTTSKLRVTDVCEGNSPVASEFPAQMASNSENAFVWWRHHVLYGNIIIVSSTQRSLCVFTQPMRDNIPWWQVSPLGVDSVHQTS